jgi:hypothetical protein
MTARRSPILPKANHCDVERISLFRSACLAFKWVAQPIENRPDFCTKDYQIIDKIRSGLTSAPER